MKENSDGNDTNVGSIGNSIEEDIKILEEFKTNGYSILLMKYGDRIKTNFKLAKAIEHILSNYKRVLKENEILKEEKEQAWEEWNNLEQGSYGTEQKLKQQIKELKKDNEELKKDYYNVINKIENKIDILDIAISECIYIDDDDKAYKKAVLKDKLCLLNQKRALQELLEGRE